MLPVKPCCNCHRKAHSGLLLFNVLKDLTFVTQDSLIERCGTVDADVCAVVPIIVSMWCKPSVRKAKVPMGGTVYRSHCVSMLTIIIIVIKNSISRLIVTFYQCKTHRLHCNGCYYQYLEIYLDVRINVGFVFYFVEKSRFLFLVASECCWIWSCRSTTADTPPETILLGKALNYATQQLGMQLFFQRKQVSTGKKEYCRRVQQNVYKKHK